MLISDLMCLGFDKYLLVAIINNNNNYTRNTWIAGPREGQGSWKGNQAIRKKIYKLKKLELLYINKQETKQNYNN